MSFTRTWFSLPRWGNVSQSLAEEPHPRSRSELNIGYVPGIASPAHVASNNMTILEYSLHDRYMTQSVGSFDPGLEYDNSSERGAGRNAPAKLIGARYPLPGVGLRSPGNKDAMQLEITLIGPPRTGSIGEEISRAGGRVRAGLPVDLPDVAIHLHDADKLPPVNTIGVGEPVFRGKFPPTNPVAPCNRAQSIAVSHNVWYGSVWTESLPLSLFAIQTQARSQNEQRR